MDVIGFLILGGGVIWATWAIYTKVEEKERETKQRALALQEQERSAIKQERAEKRQEEWEDQQHKLRTAESTNYLVELKIRNIRLEMEMISAQRELEAIRNPKPQITRNTDPEEKRRRQRENELKKAMEEVEFEILKTAKTRTKVKDMVRSMMEDELKGARDEHERESIRDQYDALEDRLLNKVK